ncbi:hypothetical protein BH20ACT6_BH20ACT6_18710 [soil metagenome]
MTPWRLVAEREIATRIRDKSFLISTAVLLGLVLAGIVVGVVGRRPTTVVRRRSDQPGRCPAGGGR